MGFKCLDMPSREVLAASGSACQFFQKKEKPKTGGE
jgi:hypothetical protein